MAVIVSVADDVVVAVELVDVVIDVKLMSSL